MEIFVDTADVDEVRRAAGLGWVDGVTTNPTLLRRAGTPMLDTIRRIASLIGGPVSAEVLAEGTAEIVEEGRRLSAIASNVVVKVPLTPAGLAATRTLAHEGIPTNVTLCFSPIQAVLAAKAGATYVSPFVGRLDDAGHDGMAMVADVCRAFRHYGFSTKVLVASVRSPAHVRGALELGAHAVTAPPSVLERLVSHPLTEQGLARFAEDGKGLVR